jgi:hypothetical protein
MNQIKMFVRRFVVGSVLWLYRQCVESSAEIEANAIDAYLRIKNLREIEEKRFRALFVEARQ